MSDAPNTLSPLSKETSMPPPLGRNVHGHKFTGSHPIAKSDGSAGPGLTGTRVIFSEDCPVGTGSTLSTLPRYVMVRLLEVFEKY